MRGSCVYAAQRVFCAGAILRDGLFFSPRMLRWHSFGPLEDFRTGSVLCSRLCFVALPSGQLYVSFGWRSGSRRQAEDSLAAFAAGGTKNRTFARTCIHSTLNEFTYSKTPINFIQKRKREKRESIFPAPARGWQYK